MLLRKLNINAVAPFDYAFEPAVAALMADIRRSIGSASIGLTIQTVRPGNRL